MTLGVKTRACAGSKTLLAAESRPLDPHGMVGSLRLVWGEPLYVAASRNGSEISRKAGCQTLVKNTLFVLAAVIEEDDVTAGRKKSEKARHQGRDNVEHARRRTRRHVGGSSPRGGGSSPRRLLERENKT